MALYHINQILLPKYIYKNNIWPTTSSYNQFYKMEKNTVDVLFLGSSVCVNAFSPQEIYNSYGIRSYNLGSDQQSIFLSYFWLKEAARFQSPQVVVLDTKFLFDIHPENEINTTEGLTRKCLDPMRWSDVKAEAVDDLCTIDKEQSKLSYYLTNIRFHSRWSSLEEYDIDLSEVQYAELKGHSATTNYGPQSCWTFDPSDPDKYDGFEPAIGPVMMEYLDRIVEFCQESSISLVLVSLPGNEMNDGIHNTLTRYSNEHHIDYYNLCETKNYEEIGAVLPKENVIHHSNLWGSIKMSRYIGKLLSEIYGVPSVQDSQWEDTKDYYTQTIKNCELSHISDFEEYLEAVNDPNYSVFISVKNDAVGGLSDEQKQALREFGLETNFDDKYRYSYYAVVIPGENIIEKAGKEALTATGSFRNGRSIYKITSWGYYVNNMASIEIDGEEYCINERGLNFVVYDNKTMKVIDQVCFDTGAKGGDTIR